MNPIKSPHQLLLEEAGASLDPSPGLVNTPQQMLMQQANILPHLALGGAVTPADMQAALIVNGNTPQHFANGSLVKNIGTQAAFSLPFMAEDAKDIAQDIKNKKYKEAAAKTAGVGYSAFAPWNPLAALISGMTYSPEVGDATLDTYKQKQAEHEAEVSARAQALSPVFKWNKPATLDEMQQKVLGYPNIPLPKVK